MVTVLRQSPASGAGPRRSLWEQPTSRSGGSSSYLLHYILLFCGAGIAGLYGMFAWRVMKTTSGQPTNSQQQSSSNMATTSTRRINKQQQQQRAASSASHCEFREYAPHRYYGLPNPTQPDFLRDTEYIHGEWPQLLPVIQHQQQRAAEQKLCVNQSSWRNATKHLPFADGTNPSILSVQRYQEATKEKAVQFDSEVKWLATVCMTNSQCRWRESDGLDDLYKTPDTVRTVLLLLNDQFETVQEVTISMKPDLAYGTNRRHQKQAAGGEILLALDDARLFVHAGQLWVSYREGKLFGYDSQVLNPIHLAHANENDQWTATIWASETTTFCCGRNMALLENTQVPQQLLSLTWVDPVTVIHVDTTPYAQKVGKKNKDRRRRLTEVLVDGVFEPQPEYDDEPPEPPVVTALESLRIPKRGGRRRRLSEAKKKKSHIHGTNAFMVPFGDDKDSGEYLGVAHFHRPNDRKENPYARFGHHYTHAFYTIARDAASHTPLNEAWRLTALSPEWVLPAAAAGAKGDAEIIQFVSGLEWDAAATRDVILAYGVNDCEGAVVRIAHDTVQQWLRPVAQSQQVVDFMKQPPPPRAAQ